MTLLHPSSRADEATRSRGQRYRSDAELRIREALEIWGKERWPGRRTIHELGIDRGSVRADMAFVGEDTFSACEIKSAYDGSDRLINQIAMFRLASPEVWLVMDTVHCRDAALMGYLLPSIGLMEARVGEAGVSLEVTREPGPFRPEPECLLSLLWVEELAAAAARLGIRVPARASHAVLRARMADLSDGERLRVVCHGLLARQTLWRADPPSPPREDAEEAGQPATTKDVADRIAPSTGRTIRAFT